MNSGNSERKDESASAHTNQPLLDRWLTRLRSTPAVAVIILLSAVIIGTAQTTGALREILELFGAKQTGTKLTIPSAPATSDETASPARDSETSRLAVPGSKSQHEDKQLVGWPDPFVGGVSADADGESVCQAVTRFTEAWDPDSLKTPRRPWKHTTEFNTAVTQWEAKRLPHASACLVEEDPATPSTKYTCDWDFAKSTQAYEAFLVLFRQVGSCMGKQQVIVSKRGEQSWLFEHSIWFDFRVELLKRPLSSTEEFIKPRPAEEIARVRLRVWSFDGPHP